MEKSDCINELTVEDIITVEGESVVFETKNELSSFLFQNE